MHRVLGIASSMERLGEDASAVILLKHFILSGASSEDLDDVIEACIDFTGMDVDDVIVEEHGGGRLVVGVISRILQQRRRAEVLHRKISEHRDKLNHASILKEAVHDIVWDYL